MNKGIGQLVKVLLFMRGKDADPQSRFLYSHGGIDNSDCKYTTFLQYLGDGINFFIVPYHDREDGRF